MLLHFAPDTGQLQTKSCCQERLMDCLMSAGPDKPGPGPGADTDPGLPGEEKRREHGMQFVLLCGVRGSHL